MRILNILLTGSTGFVGRALLDQLNLNETVAVKAVVRRKTDDLPSGCTSVQINGLLCDTNWSEALSSIDVVIHTAARVHLINDISSDPLAEFREINTLATLNLARQAALAGVRRFIFISSIKVNGEGTPLNQPYTANDMPAPVDLYGVSKCEAEDGLRKLTLDTGMEVVIIRPPLVYGPGVKANFLSMMHWLDMGVPLPLGAINNKRSLVALDNLVDLIVTCIDHPAATNQTFLVSDGEDLSTTELLCHMSAALGKPARLLPMPAWMLKSGAALLGKRDIAQRLLGSLQVDISKTREILNWKPPVSVDEALKKTADDFLARQKH